jgi:hypothetical protein
MIDTNFAQVIVAVSHFTAREEFGTVIGLLGTQSAAGLLTFLPNGGK